MNKRAMIKCRMFIEGPAKSCFSPQLPLLWCPHRPTINIASSQPPLLSTITRYCDLGWTTNINYPGEISKKNPATNTHTQNEAKQQAFDLFLQNILDILINRLPHLGLDSEE
jgi:hypothetical protein